MTESTRHFLNIIHKGKNTEVNKELSKYVEKGEIQYKEVLRIPRSDRLPNLVSVYGEQKINAILVISLTNAFSLINITNTLSENQIVQLGAMIIESASEDNLAIQDVLLFLKKLVTGQTKSYYNVMDVPTFFRLFEEYREQRHQENQNYNYEKAMQHKETFDPDRSSDSRMEVTEMKTALLKYNIQKDGANRNIPKVEPSDDP